MEPINTNDGGNACLKSTYSAIVIAGNVGGFILAIIFFANGHRLNGVFLALMFAAGIIFNGGKPKKK